MKKIILIIICLLFLTGCYDYQELSDMNIVNGIGIDFKDEEYIVSLETVKSSKGESSSKITTNVISGKDKILANAINQAINNSGKKAYFKHVDLVIISEELAKNGIGDVVDYMLRDVTVSSSFFTVVAEDPNEILTTEIDDGSISSLIVDTIKYNVDATQIDNIDLIVSNIINEKKDIALPYIEMKDENAIIDNIAYFKKAKMVGKMNNKIYNFLILKSDNLDFDNGDNVINIYKKDIKYDVKKDKILIDIKGMGKVKKINEDTNLEDKDSYRKIEKGIQETIATEVEEFIDEALESESDLVGFKDLYYKIYGKEKDKIPYEVNVDIKITRNGAIYETIHN